MEKINITPRNTSKNFGINDYLIDSKLFNIKPDKFEKYKTNIKLNEIRESINLKYGIGTKAFNQIMNYSNFSNELIIDKSGIITFELNDKNNSLIDYLKIEVPENKSINLIINYKSNKKGDFYHNGLIKTILNNNSKLNIVVVNMINNESVNLLSIDSECKDNSKLDFVIVDFGGNKSITNYYSGLFGENAINNLNSIYLGNQNQEFDLNYIVEIYGEKGKVSIDAQGALMDEAKKKFKGTIDFKKGCKKSIGDENEFCLLLSRKCKSVSLPMLLCSEEDVEGSHASSAGKIDDKELFYIESRGINRIDAEKLLVRAKFNKTLDLIKDEDIKNEIIKMLEEKM